MLTLKVPLTVEGFNNDTEEFIEPEVYLLKLEHSLVSLSKWESHFEKPFLKSEKSPEELLWYISAMVHDENPPGGILQKLTQENLLEVDAHIGSKMTATTFNKRGKDKPSKEIITAELIYYWMIALNIPFECQNWHLNRLLTLIEVCNLKNAPEKKLSRSEMAERQREMRELNAKRRADSGSTG